MKAVLQRVCSAHVEIAGETTATINQGLMVLLGVEKEDAPADARYLAEKTLHLRIFEDAAGKMNRSLVEIGGELLVVSQFTLAGECRKGRRPSFMRAAPPETARQLYECFIRHCREKKIVTQTGRFQTMMNVHLVNSGPVTLILDTRLP